MSIRCYLPTTIAQLQHGLATAAPVTAFCPDPSHRQLRGEELEEREYQAFLTAAAAAAETILATGGRRIVLALDVPDQSGVSLGDGIEALTLTGINDEWISSAHIDEDEVAATADRQRSDDQEAAWHTLSDSALLWFDASELTELVQTLGQLPADHLGDTSLN